MATTVSLCLLKNHLPLSENGQFVVDMIEQGTRQSPCETNKKIFSVEKRFLDVIGFCTSLTLNSKLGSGSSHSTMGQNIESWLHP